MLYVTVPASPKYKHMDIEDLWFGDDDKNYGGVITQNSSNTVTRCMTVVPRGMRSTAARVSYQVAVRLSQFVHSHRNLLDAERHSLYRTFYVPKSSGGLRRIDAPNEDLMVALRELKAIFESECGAMSLYHTSAFAYIHNRNTIECVKRHQLNKSKWFGKFDLHNFFGSTTIDFIIDMFRKIYPFAIILRTVQGESVLRDALELCCLDGVLPQGTPMSPMLTNIMMIPIDFEISKKLRELDMVYTRYADDFLISSRKPFRFKDVEEIIMSVLASFNAPFQLNTKKTRYGSSSGANWNFGIMLNKDNQMTIGRSKKKQFESMLTAYAKNKKAGANWSLEDVQHLDGLRAYYKAIEGETIDRIVAHISEKHGVDVRRCIKDDLRNLWYTIDKI